MKLLKRPRRLAIPLLSPPPFKFVLDQGV